MKDVRTVTEWHTFVSPALQSKVDELHVLGYDKATEEQVWNCLIKKVWKKDIDKRLYEVVQDILHLDSGVFMSYLAREIYQERNDDLMAQIEALTGNDL
ncbi:Post-transcriptional regulator [Salinibacillus kushneri]|uniref:Post-transcriptional regulator n=1 Tax=Salinibacillus kushneri TaxID=237682 RepID=A0A1I0GAF1_9BACI|nr:post-transcriptional regulator [Salinibacillus kushneri]SET67082.1 Post-transcriptional regulator [Salinibacillus kushneri]